MFGKLKFEYKISLLYLFIGFMWILFSDRFLETFFSVEQLIKLQTIKGSFYVLATACILFVFVKRNEIKRNKAKAELVRLNNDLSASEEELKTANEELTATGEALKDNLSEIKHAKEIAEENEKQFKLLVENAPEGIFIQIEGKFAYVNRAAIKIYGAKSDAELLGTNVLDRAHPDYLDFIKERIKQLNENVTIVTKVEYKHLRLDGSSFDVSVSAVPIKYNRKQGALVFVSDITEKKLAENAIIESESKFRNLFQNHAAVKLIIEPETGQIVEANRAAANFYGWSCDELMLMNIAQINHLSKDEIAAELINANTSKKNYFEFKHRKANGTICDVEVYSSMIMVNGKNMLHSIIHDITEKKKHEQQIKLLSHSVEQNPVSIIITDRN